MSLQAYITPQPSLLAIANSPYAPTIVSSPSPESGVMHNPYSNTPSPQAYPITGGLIVSEPASMLHDARPSPDILPDVYNKTRPRPAFSHSAILNTPSPAAAWPRRVMTAPVPLIPAIDPAIDPDVRIDDGAHDHAPGDNDHRHEADTPSLSHSTTSTSSTATHPHPSSTSHHPYGYPHYTSPYSTPSYPPGEYPYAHQQQQHSSPYGAPVYPQPSYSQSEAWGMSSSAVHPMAHHQQQYSTWGGGMPATTTAGSGGKQDEPILAPGELPAPRPPMSYAALIGEALLLAPPPHQLYVSEISDSIKKRYPYYRQNPTKIYNGVRHQTSMCKAFVKLPRPYGCQSASARKWGIRAGCESWFANGGYHPPSNAVTTNKSSHSSSKSSGGKAKSTARSKHLAIGTNGEMKKLPPGFPSPDSSDGPSSGPAYDGSTGAVAPYQSQAQQQSYGSSGPFSSPQPSHLPPGYHYVPVNPAPGHPQPSQPIYVPVWGPYAAPNPPPQYGQHQHQHPHQHQHGYQHSGYEGSQSPRLWRRGGDEERYPHPDPYAHHPHSHQHDGGQGSYDEPKMMHHASSYDEPKDLQLPPLAQLAAGAAAAGGTVGGDGSQAGGSPSSYQDRESLHSSQPSPEQAL
ncbi:hypothetical protein IAR50_004067 [Cryptococcus sp. DSM 104548]